MYPATWKRMMQFEAGPNELVFGACDEHKPLLEAGDRISCFFARDRDPVEPADEDEAECHFCWGENGP